MNILKSIGAVVAGFITVVVLSVGADFILESSGFFPPQTHPEAYTAWMLAFALLYRTIFTVAGGFVTAWLAPGNRVRHGIILGAFGMLAGTAGAVANWGMTAEHWYPVALVVLAIPSTWAGAKLAVMCKK